MIPEDGNATTTKLLTLLNVSATKATKRKRPHEDEASRAERLNKRTTAEYILSEAGESQKLSDDVSADAATPEKEEDAKSEEVEELEGASAFLPNC